MTINYIKRAYDKFKRMSAWDKLTVVAIATYPVPLFFLYTILTCGI